MERDKKVTTLRDREEMEKRLLALNEDPHIREHFYPILLAHAGEERYATGVALQLTLAIHDYVQGMPPIMGGLMYMRANSYIDALVSDPDAAKEAKSILAEAVKESRKK